jgi:hypothetical protein
VQLVSLCPFNAGVVLWEASPEQRRLSVLVKGTFSLAHGAVATIAPAQVPLNADWRCYDHELASLYAPADRVPFKPRTDIMLVGHARAPGGVPLPTLTVRMSVGTLSKSLWVTGEQRWMQGPSGLVPSAMTPFVEMPIQYERAAQSAYNPVGVRAGTQAPGALAAPCLHTTGDAMIAGFGPISPRWRARSADRASLAWSEAMATTGIAPGPAPAGLDYRIFNAAPRDQQVPEIAAGAKVVLEALHPALPCFETYLPVVAPQAFVLPASARLPVELPMRCDTVWINADRSHLVMTWRGVLDLATVQPDANIVVVAEPAGARMRVEDVVRALGTRGAFHREEVPLDKLAATATARRKPGMTLPGTRSVPAEVLPFVPKEPAPPHRPPQPNPRDLLMSMHAAEITAAVSERPLPPALPFVSPTVEHSPPSSRRLAPPDRQDLFPRRDDDESTEVKAHVSERRTLPFVVPNKDGPPPSSPVPDLPKGVPSGLPFVSAAPPPPPRVLPPPAVPPPPPMQEVAVPATDKPSASFGFGMRLGVAEAPPPPAPAPAPPAPAPIAKAPEREENGLSLETYARVKAALWDEGASRDEVLRRHETTETAFREAERRWVDVIADEAKQGRAERALAVRAAIASAVEEGPAPVESEPSLDEYAQIRVLLEDAEEIEPVLAARGLSVLAWRKLDATMRRRAQVDPALQKSLRGKLVEMRAASKSSRHGELGPIPAGQLPG